MRIVLTYMTALVALIGVYWTTLFFVQRQLLFPAPRPTSAPAQPTDAQQLWLSGAAGATEAWYLPPLPPTESPAPLLIFAHGNGELIEYWPAAFAEPRQWGMAVMLVEYPGYGRSPGQPSERTIAATFQAAYDRAATAEEVDRKRIVGYGRSLGGGVIGVLSGSRDLAAMILESTFTSIQAFTRGFAAPGFLVRDPFDNVAALRAFTGPLLLIHGSHDEIIPVEHGRTLARIRQVPLHELRCGHNDCPRSWPLIKQFLVTARILLPAAGRHLPNS
jgi:uncharacterized protein